MEKKKKPLFKEGKKGNRSNLLKTDLLTENENEKGLDEKSKQFFSMVIIFIAALIIIVYLAFRAISFSPIPKINKDEGIQIMTSLASSQWSYDEGDSPVPESLKQKCYKKLEFSNQLISEDTRMPMYFFQEDTNNGLAMELGFVYYDSCKQGLFVQLPSTDCLKFLYSQASSQEMENISFISDSNKRCFFIKKELIK